MDVGEKLFVAAIMLIFVYVAMYLQIAIHEGGHLVAGLLSGYQFSSYRIGSFMWMKQDGKIRFKRFSLAGTGGQCLMAPPELADGRIPVKFYNFGGVIANIFSSIIGIILYLCFRDAGLYVNVLLIFVIVGIGFAMVNGIPLKMGDINNDGYNAISIEKDKDSMRSFWIQMKMNEEQSRGLRLKDMPDEWFRFPEDEAMNNSMVAIEGVLVCNRHMDLHQFEKANEMMKHILEIDSGIIDIHKLLLECDRIYCELLENHLEEAEILYTDELKKFMKRMRTFPSVIRTNYAYELVVHKNQENVEKWKLEFEKCAKKYPYTGDIESERELMDIISDTRQVKA